MADDTGDEEHLPEFYAGKGDTKLTPAFKAFARELGDEFGPRALQVKGLVKGRFARTRLKHLFGLTEDQIDSVLVEAGATAAWRPRLEETFGFTFTKVQSCPPSANLVTLGNPRVKAAEGKRSVFRINTISAQLGDAVKRCAVSPFIMNFLTIVPGQILSEAQFGVLSTLWILWLFAKKGQSNVGVELIRLHAKQFTAHFPNLVPINSGKNTRFRDWAEVLTNKSELWSRKDAEVKCLDSNAHQPIALP